MTLRLLSVLIVATGAAAQPLHVPFQHGSATAWPREDDALRLFVRLELPAVAELRARAIARGSAGPDAREQRLHGQTLRQHQDRVSAAMAPWITRELGRLQMAVNGIKVIAPRSSISRIKAIPGVQHVSRIAQHDVDNAASVNWVQAPQVWKTLGDGGDMTIAIIDTGIDYLHANFGGAGDPEAYAANDKSVIEPGTFPTAKVIGGWDFAGPTYNSREDDVPQPDPDPLDGNGHGSHVGGTAAGIGVTNRIGPGVAPGAKILALKVFSDESGSTDLTADAIDYALDPDQDGVMDDRVDVINMSLGSRYGDPNDPAALASDIAAQNGVVVVASAGNNGDRSYVTGSPAVSPGAISVAATIAGGRPQAALRVISANPTVSGIYAAAEGAGPVRVVDSPLIRTLVSARGPAAPGDDVVPAEGEQNDEACASLHNRAEAAGNILLVKNGSCTSETKYAVAQQAGAVGIVVYNAVGDQTGPPRVMGGIGISGKEFTIPGMMIGGEEGQKLREALISQTFEVEFNVENTAPPIAELADQTTFFTSRGPSHGGAGFKPDLAAPGRFIMSTDAGSGFRGRQLRGTSMAAPHVAGAAALLRQRYPDAPVPVIKALLQNATVDSEFEGPGSDTVSPLSRQGTGVIRIADSLALQSYALPASVSFGYQALAQDALSQRQIEVHDLSGTERVFAISHRPRGELPGVQVSCPASLTVPAGSSATFSIDLEITVADLPADPGFMSHREADGWCVLEDENDTLRVGYIAAADPLSEVLVSATPAGVTLSNPGPVAGLAHGFRLAGQGGDMGAGASRPIAAVGTRFANTFGLNVFQLGIALEQTWEAPAHVSMQMFIDPDRNGSYSKVLFAGDWSLLGFDPGSWVTGVFDLDAEGEPDFDSGYLDWIAEEVDFNDGVVFASWTLNPELGLSFLKPDARIFDYRLVVFSRDGSYDVQTGSIDLDQTPVGTATPWQIPAGDTQEISFPDATPDFWLLPANAAHSQHALISAPRKILTSTRRPAGTKLSAH